MRSMHKYENCVIKCKNKYELEMLYNRLGEIGVEEANKDIYGDERIHYIYYHNYNENTPIWMLIDYIDKPFTGLKAGYFYFFRQSFLNEWLDLQQIPYHTFFRKEKINSILKK